MPAQQTIARFIQLRAEGRTFVKSMDFAPCLSVFHEWRHPWPSAIFKPSQSTSHQLFIKSGVIQKNYFGAICAIFDLSFAICHLPFRLSASAIGYHGSRITDDLPFAIGYRLSAIGYWLITHHASPLTPHAPPLTFLPRPSISAGFRLIPFTAQAYSQQKYTP